MNYLSHAHPVSSSTAIFVASCVVHCCMSYLRLSACLQCHSKLYLSCLEKWIVGWMISALVTSDVMYLLIHFTSLSLSQMREVTVCCNCSRYSRSKCKNMVTVSTPTDSALYALFDNKQLSTKIVPPNKTFIPEISCPSLLTSILGA